MEFFWFTGAFGGLFIFILLLSLASLAFKIWMLVDAVQRPVEHFPTQDQRTWWIVGLAVGLVVSLIGLGIAIAYFIIIRKPALEGASPGAATAPAGGSLYAPPIPPAPPSRPLNCRTCAAKLPAGARFCHSCGTPVQPEGP